MAGYQRCISLPLLCLLLCHDSLAAQMESTACKYQEKYRAHEKFLIRHIRPPITKNVEELHTFLRDLDPTRPIQSFLQHRELLKVKAVCSNKGGQQYIVDRLMTNLCISRKPFNFFTVDIKDADTYIIKYERRKHLILACDKVNNICLPTHFQPNRENSKPVANAKGCQGGTNYG